MAYCSPINSCLAFLRFLNDTEIAKAQRDFELKKAAYDVEVQTKVRFCQMKIVKKENTAKISCISSCEADEEL